MFRGARTFAAHAHTTYYTRGRMVATAAQSSSALVFEAKMTELSEEDARKLQDGMTVLNSILSELFAFHSRFVCVALCFSLLSSPDVFATTCIIRRMRMCSKSSHAPKHRKREQEILMRMSFSASVKRVYTA